MFAGRMPRPAVARAATPGRMAAAVPRMAGRMAGPQPGAPGAMAASPGTAMTPPARMAKAVPNPVATDIAAYEQAWAGGA